MTRRLAGGKLVVASHNPGKVHEIAALMAPFNIETISASSIKLAEPEETEATFAGNALIKAKAAAIASKLPALADDSGLCVDAIDGQPGIYSARWAGPTKDFQLAMFTLHERMQQANATTHSAHFTCALALAWPNGESEVFEGEVAGEIVWPPRGDLGFGYDPIFVPKGHVLTFGEMPPAQKHGMSHRAHAFKKFVSACLG